VRQAFIMITLEKGSEAEVLKALEEIPEVKETYQVYGVYDIIAKVEAENMPELEEIIIQKIKLLDNVQSMMTMICLDPEGSDQA